MPREIPTGYEFDPIHSNEKHRHVRCQFVFNGKQCQYHNRIGRLKFNHNHIFPPEIPKDINSLLEAMFTFYGSTNISLKNITSNEMLKIIHNAILVGVNIGQSKDFKIENLNLNDIFPKMSKNNFKKMYFEQIKNQEKELMQSLEGNAVSATIDAGTILKKSALNISIFNPSFMLIPFPLMILPDFIGNSESYGSVISLIREKLGPNIELAGITTDNLPVQVASIDHRYSVNENKILRLSCVCHDIQLALDDFLAAVPSKTLDFGLIRLIASFLRKKPIVRFIHAICPRYNPTRWNILRDILEFTTDNIDKIISLVFQTPPSVESIVSRFTPYIIDILDKQFVIMYILLQPLASLTTIFESNRIDPSMVLPIFTQFFGDYTDYINNIAAAINQNESAECQKYVVSKVKDFGARLKGCLVNRLETTGNRCILELAYSLSRYGRYDYQLRFKYLRGDQAKDVVERPYIPKVSMPFNKAVNLINSLPNILAFERAAVEPLQEDEGEYSDDDEPISDDDDDYMPPSIDEDNPFNLVDKFDFSSDQTSDYDDDQGQNPDDQGQIPDDQGQIPDDQGQNLDNEYSLPPHLRQEYTHDQKERMRERIDQLLPLINRQNIPDQIDITEINERKSFEPTDEQPSAQDEEEDTQQMAENSQDDYFGDVADDPNDTDYTPETRSSSLHQVLSANLNENLLQTFPANRPGECTGYEQAAGIQQPEKLAVFQALYQIANSFNFSDVEYTALLSQYHSWLSKSNSELDIVNNDDKYDLWHSLVKIENCSLLAKFAEALFSMSATEVECEREFSFVTNLFDIHATRASALLIENKMKGSYMKRYNQLKEYVAKNNVRRPYIYSEVFERYDSAN